MESTSEHLKALEEIERDGLPSLAEVLHEEGLDTIRRVLWGATRCTTSISLQLGATGLRKSRSAKTD
jgi:hypothetical protein